MIEYSQLVSTTNRLLNYGFPELNPIVGRTLLFPFRDEVGEKLDITWFSTPCACPSRVCVVPIQAFWFSFHFCLLFLLLNYFGFLSLYWMVVERIYVIFVVVVLGTSLVPSWPRPSVVSSIYSRVCVLNDSAIVSGNPERCLTVRLFYLSLAFVHATSPGCNTATDLSRREIEPGTQHDTDFAKEIISLSLVKLN